MVVIGMCPTRRIDLTGRNAHRTQGCHQESRFLAATPVSRLHRRQRRGSPRIARRINSLFMAPVVHLQNGIVHRQAFHPLGQFIIKHPAARIQILVVDPDRQHEMPELLLRHVLAPRHLPPDLERHPHIAQVKLSLIIRYIAQRHISIQERHRLPFFRGHLRLVKDRKETPVRKKRLLPRESRLSFLPLRPVREKRLVITRISDHAHRRQHQNP